MCAGEAPSPGGLGDCVTSLWGRRHCQERGLQSESCRHQESTLGEWGVLALFLNWGAGDCFWWLLGLRVGSVRPYLLIRQEKPETVFFLWDVPSVHYWQLRESFPKHWAAKASSSVSEWPVGLRLWPLTNHSETTGKEGGGECTPALPHQTVPRRWEEPRPPDPAEVWSSASTRASITRVHAECIQLSPHWFLTTGSKARERSTDATHQLVCAFRISHKVMKSAVRGQAICTSVAPLTFTAWLAILKEDRVHLLCYVLRPAVGNHMVSIARWVAKRFERLPTPTLLRDLVTNK